MFQPVVVLGVADQVACMGCLSQCRFSNWSQHEPEYSNGKKADPRSFCIQKTLAIF